MAALGGAIGRGTGIGFVLGLIPGVGAVIPTFMAYIAREAPVEAPENFGNGAIEGVAAPETANNAYANAAMVPLLVLGVPSSPTIAVLMGAFIINGLTPGPFLFKERPDLVWTVIASFFVGNVILLVLNLPLVGLWAKLLRLPVQLPVRGHAALLHRRRLQPEAQRVRRRRHARVRRDRLRAAQARPPARAGGARR